MTQRLQEAVLERIDANWQQEVGFLREMVAQRSVLGQEAGVQERIAAELLSMRLEPSLWPVEGEQLSARPGFSGPVHAYDGRPNLSARVEGSGDGRSLSFNGHVDVVPAAPDHQWRFDPWSGTIEGERMYGRGAADMKAGIAAMIYAVRAIGEADVSLAGDILIDTVIEEECTGNGTLAALARRRPGTGAIIPEPFNQTLMTAQVGVLWTRITVRGKGAHVLGAEKAVNAVQKAQLVVDAIRELEREANESVGRPPRFRDLEHPLNYNVGVVRGGDWPSSVPSECTLEVRISAFPGADLDAVAANFREALLDIVRRDEWLARNQPEVEFFGFRAEGCSLDDHDDLFATLDRAHERVAGGKPERYVSTATTDVRFFVLYYDTPATCYGPVGGNLHAPDEWVDLPSLKETTAVLALAAMEWCGVVEE